MSYSDHHACSLIQNPLASLKPGSTDHTTVAYLDSWMPNQTGLVEDSFFARLLVQVWRCLEGRRADLGLFAEEPSISQLLESLEVVRPAVIHSMAVLWTCVADFLLHLGSSTKKQRGLRASCHTQRAVTHGAA